MRTRNVLAALLLMQCLIMFFSYSLNHEVYKSVLMVIYASAILFLGSFIGSYFENKLVGVEIRTVNNCLAISGFVFIVTLVAKLYLNFPEIEFSTYKSISQTFLMNPFGMIGTLNHMAIFLMAIFSGVFLGLKVDDIRQNNNAKIYLLLILCIATVIIFTGSRSIIILFFFAFIAAVSDIKTVLKSKLILLRNTMKMITQNHRS